MYSIRSQLCWMVGVKMEINGPFSQWICVKVRRACWTGVCQCHEIFFKSVRKAQFTACPPGVKSKGHPTQWAGVCFSQPATVSTAWHDALGETCRNQEFRGAPLIIKENYNKKKKKHPMQTTPGRTRNEHRTASVCICSFVLQQSQWSAEVFQTCRLRLNNK